MALCNPLVMTVAIVVLATSFPTLAGFVVPAAPNLSHIVVFGAALVVAPDPHPS
jgi:hypothetical protein